MKKTMIVFALALCAAVSYADGPVAKGTNESKLTPEQRAERRRKIKEYFGGDILDTRNQKGKIVVVNCQKVAKAEWLKEDLAVLQKDIPVTMEVAEGAFDLRKPALQGEVSIFVVDDPELPMSLVATESRWAMVNVASLKSDKGTFFEMRVKKALTRTLAYLCGAASSQFKLALTENVQKAEDYDQYVNERLPVDVIRRMIPFLAGYGVTPYVKTRYRTACQQGWAPSPTNDVQKKIWDDVHALPSDPIKIKFDPKRDK